MDANGVKQIQNGLKSGQIIGVAVGIVFFAVTMYASHLAIKAHRLTIKKLNDEGYK